MDYFNACQYSETILEHWHKVSQQKNVAELFFVIFSRCEVKMAKTKWFKQRFHNPELIRDIGLIKQCFCS